MKRLSCKAVHLSKEPSGFPDSEDVDTRGTESNIEDTNTVSLASYLVVSRSCLVRCLALVWSLTCVLSQVEEGDLVGGGAG